VIHPSPLGDVQVPAVALTGHVLADVAAHPLRPALIDGPTGEVVTYAELEWRVRSLAGGLVSAGLRKGDVVALLAPNCPSYAVVFHAVALAGGVVTTINPTYTAGEVHHQLLDSGATRLVTTAAFLATAADAASGTGVAARYLLDGTATDGAIPLVDVFGSPLDHQVPVEPDDIVVLPYSSGTTGLAKGVMLSHRNLVANLLQTQAVLRIEEGESFAAVLPFFHIYGMQVLMNLGLVAGATVVTMPRFDLDLFLALHEEHELTRAFVAPPIVVALAKHPAVDDHDLSLRTVLSGAAPLSADLAVEAAGRLGCEVVQGYGMTELSPVSHVTPAGDATPGSVGVAVPGTEVRVVNVATGEDLDVGADGEVWIRGPQVMMGYLGNPDATATTIDGDGWLHTGDVGHLDTDGHLFIVDRVKELIKVSGFQVPPAELEALLLTHPDVIDAAVVGVPDDQAGEVPVAFVVRRPGATTPEDEMQAFVAKRVATYKRIHRLDIVESIPKSASGKILRRVLRDGAIA
jgi:4-coumarate--CoA ligase